MILFSETLRLHIALMWNRDHQNYKSYVFETAAKQSYLLLKILIITVIAYIAGGVSRTPLCLFIKCITEADEVSSDIWCIKN
jgi:hypothetical protein